jgi:polysaccharide biosynthesis/export protein
LYPGVAGRAWGRKRDVTLQEKVGAVLAAIFTSSLLLGACSIMPASAPAGVDIRNRVRHEANGLTYGLVPLDREAVRLLTLYEAHSLVGAFSDRRPPVPLVFGIGDVVSVTIFEAAAGGLFIPIEAGARPGNFVTMPDQQIDNNGNITIPYAGQIKADGLTAPQIQASIVAALKDRAIDPQAIVAQSQQRTSLVSVLGEVNNPIRYPAAALGAGDRILDAIARAGGIKGQGYDTWVTLERNGQRASVPFGNLVYNPSNNIYVRPGDRIYVYVEPQTFLAFGASGTQGQFSFNQWRLTLAEAVAKAGGLVDAQADPGSVFLYRPVQREIAEMLGMDCSPFPGPWVPVIFNVNLKDPGGYFLATQTQMINKDVIVVSNAPAVEITKVVLFLQNIILTTDYSARTILDIKAIRTLQ